METKTDAEKKLLDIYYRLGMDEITGKTPESALIDYYEKTKSPKQLEHWCGVRENTLIIAMWAYDDSIGVQFVAANLAALPVRKGKKEPVIANFKAFMIILLILPYLAIVIGHMIAISWTKLIGLLFGFSGIIIFLFLARYAYIRIKDATDRLALILLQLDLNYTSSQIEIYKGILRIDYYHCYILAGMHFIFQLLFTLLIVFL